MWESPAFGDFQGMIITVNLPLDSRWVRGIKSCGE